MQAVEPVQRDIAAHERDEFAAAERAGEPHQEDGGVAAFEDLIRPTRTVCPRLVDDGDDVGGQQRRPRGAGPLPRRCIVPPDPGQGRGDQLVAAGSRMPGAAVVEADARHPAGQRGGRVGPLPRLRHRRGGAQETGGNSERMRRQWAVPFALAPGGEPGPVGGIVAARRLGARPRRRPATRAMVSAGRAGTDGAAESDEAGAGASEGSGWRISRSSGTKWEPTGSHRPSRAGNALNRGFGVDGALMAISSADPAQTGSDIDRTPKCARSTWLQQVPPGRHFPDFVLVRRPIAAFLSSSKAAGPRAGRLTSWARTTRGKCRISTAVAGVDPGPRVSSFRRGRLACALPSYRLVVRIASAV